MLEISRSRRFVAMLINTITFNGLIIGGLILLMTKRTSVGGAVMGYRFEGGSLIILFFTGILAGLMYIVTIYIMFFVDIIGMSHRNATFAEKWAGVHKTQA